MSGNIIFLAGVCQHAMGYYKNAAEDYTKSFMINSEQLVGEKNGAHEVQQFQVHFSHMKKLEIIQDLEPNLIQLIHLESQD